jgi:hypothetical protein
MKRHSVAILVTLLGWFRSADAFAFEEQWHLGGGIGVVRVSPEPVGLGPALDVYANYGLSDMFDIKVDLAASSHAFELTPEISERRSIFTATAGVSYKLDVIDWIPYFGAHTGMIYADLPEDLGMGTRTVLVGGMIGLDYAPTPSFGLGVMNRWHFPLDGGSLVDLFLRAEYHWGS